ncbi:DUF1761 domain-containing protein [Candidatus Gracilibacteria bacterium]|nr:DUF1761 domain-containing protein [Candidatus Gracilibacteria bacterium]
MKIFSDIFHIITNISWAADISATIVAVLIGVVWYNPSVFGKAWMNGVNLKREDTQTVKARNNLFWTLPITFVIAANIAAFCKHLEYTDPSRAFLIGYDLGLIVCLFMAINYLYEQKPLTLYAINAGYTLVSMGAMGLVIGVVL